MPKVSVIGAGDVGATVAFALQISGLATEIVLLDANAQRAEGNALDLNHGLFFTPPCLIRAGDWAACAGSDVIVITAGARQQSGETRLDLTRRNAAICRGIVEQLRPHVGAARLLVVANPMDLMTQVVAEAAGLEAGRVFGSGTVLDSARFRFELSQWCGVDARNVHAYVLGEHGDSEVFVWSHVAVGAVPFETFCRGCPRGCETAQRGEIEQRVRQSAYHVIEAKGFTNYGVSLAVAKILEAILRDERSVLTVSTRLSGAYGLHGVSLSVPCVVGAGGVERVVEMVLSAEEQAGLERSAALLRSAASNAAGPL
jgi:L-lactate dehydrogenase